LSSPEKPYRSRLNLGVSEPSPGIGVIRIQGAVAKWDIEALNAAIEGLFARGVKRIIFDLSETEIVASGAFGCFIACQNQAAKVEGQILLAGVPDIVRIVFDRLGLSEMFAFAASTDAALRQLTASRTDKQGTTRRRKR